MTRAFAASAGLLLTVACATGPPPPATPGIVVFTGAVTDSATTEPFGGAIVTLLGGRARAADRDGRYRLTACLGRGDRVILSASRIGYKTKSLPVDVASDTIRMNLGLKVHPMHEDLLLPFEALDDAVFTGTVTDAATAQPLPGAVVALGGSRAVAGPEGRYRLTAGAAFGSRVSLHASRAGYYMTSRAVRARRGGTRLDLRLSPNAPVGGC